MSKTLIHCALLCEAQTFINFLKLKQDSSLQNSSSKMKLFKDKNSEIILVVSGIGKENTLKSLKFLYEKFSIKKAINIGIAGCSDTSIKIGTLFCTNKILKKINFASITTVNKALSSDGNLNTLLVDMEAKYFLDISKNHCEELYVFKVVSDYLDEKIPEKSFVTKLIQNQYPKIKNYL